MFESEETFISKVIRSLDSLHDDDILDSNPEISVCVITGFCANPIYASTQPHFSILKEVRVTVGHCHACLEGCAVIYCTKGCEVTQSRCECPLTHQYVDRFLEDLFIMLSLITNLI